jgi:hypothetical protein
MNTRLKKLNTNRSNPNTFDADKASTQPTSPASQIQKNPGFKSKKRKQQQNNI